MKDRAVIKAACKAARTDRYYPTQYMSNLKEAIASGRLRDGRTDRQYAYTLLQFAAGKLSLSSNQRWRYHDTSPKVLDKLIDNLIASVKIKKDQP